VNFQRVTTEMRAYALLGQAGGKNPNSQPIKFVLGMTARAGSLFGNSGPFFFQQQFSVGGVQYGQALRGYPEFSITPRGFNPNSSQYDAGGTGAFGNAFLTLTGELGLRLNQQFYINAFTDAGNNWASARQINPTDDAPGFGTYPRDVIRFADVRHSSSHRAGFFFLRVPDVRPNFAVDVFEFVEQVERLAGFLKNRQRADGFERLRVNEFDDVRTVAHYQIRAVIG
jgi:hypothetical protein